MGKKEIPEPILTYVRRDGNTTREIDWEIQKLFDEGQVKVRDHAETPDNKAFQFHYRVLMNRLFSEHGLRIGEGLHFNARTKLLKLINNGKEKAS